MLWSRYVTSNKLGKEFNYYVKQEAKDIEHSLRDIKGMFRVGGKYMKIHIVHDNNDVIASYSVDTDGYSQLFECKNITDCYKNLLVNIGFDANPGTGRYKHPHFISAINDNMHSSAGDVGDFDSL